MHLVGFIVRIASSCTVFIIANIVRKTSVMRAALSGDCEAPLLHYFCTVIVPALEASSPVPLCVFSYRICLDVYL